MRALSLNTQSLLINQLRFGSSQSKTTVFRHISDCFEVAHNWTLNFGAGTSWDQFLSKDSPLCRVNFAGVSLWIRGGFGLLHWLSLWRCRTAQARTVFELSNAVNIPPGSRLVPLTTFNWLCGRDIPGAPHPSPPLPSPLVTCTSAPGHLWPT